MFLVPLDTPGHRDPARPHALRRAHQRRPTTAACGFPTAIASARSTAAGRSSPTRSRSSTAAGSRPPSARARRRGRVRARRTRRAGAPESARGARAARARRDARRDLGRADRRARCSRRRSPDRRDGPMASSSPPTCSSRTPPICSICGRPTRCSRAAAVVTRRAPGGRVRLPPLHGEQHLRRHERDHAEHHRAGVARPAAQPHREGRCKAGPLAIAAKRFCAPYLRSRGGPSRSTGFAVRQPRGRLPTNATAGSDPRRRRAAPSAARRAPPTGSASSASRASASTPARSFSAIVMWLRISSWIARTCAPRPAA